MSEIKCDTFTLTYCGIYGKTLKVSNKGHVAFLPLSQIKFKRPTPVEALKPIKVEIPLWLARNKGLL